MLVTWMESRRSLPCFHEQSENTNGTRLKTWTEVQTEAVAKIGWPRHTQATIPETNMADIVARKPMSHFEFHI
jgi:hypothetical protein